MMTKIYGGKVITDRKIEEKNVYFENGKIIAVTDADLPCDEMIDAKGMYVSPAFVEIHTHGADGHDFLDNTEEAYLAIAKAHAEHGAGTILPTITSASEEHTLESVKVFERIRDKVHDGANMPGLHLEGPYFSPAQAGAQDPEKIRKFNPDEYMTLLNATDAILRWTGAPELDGSAEFAQELTKRGILPCIGHSDADGECVKEAFKNGWTHVTHLYSATSTVHRKNAYRHIGIVECAYLIDDMTVEIIADGKHLPPDLIKMIIKIKGMDKVILVTDSLEIAGTDIVEGVMSGTEFIVEDGVCKLKDRTAFAGSVATSDRLIRVMTKECGYSICDSVYMATKVPAELLKVNKGKLENGYDADVIVFDEDINVSDIFVMGKKVK